MSDSGRQIGDPRPGQFTGITRVKTRNSVYILDAVKDRVMLVSGTPSGHLPFGQWVKVESFSAPVVGMKLWIHYTDGQTRFATTIQEIEENVEEETIQTNDAAPPAAEARADDPTNS